MAIIHIIWWPLSIFLIIFGIVWSFYGYLEFIGFGDGGTPPHKDIPLIVSGILMSIYGLLMVLNLINSFKKNFPAISFTARVKIVVT